MTEAGRPPPPDSVTSKDWVFIGEPRAGTSLAHSVLIQGPNPRARGDVPDMA